MRYFGQFTLEETQRMSAGFYRVSRPTSIRDAGDISSFVFGWIEKDGQCVWQIPDYSININPLVRQQIEVDDSDIDIIFGDLITLEEKAILVEKILNQPSITLADGLTSAIQAKEVDYQWLIDNGFVSL